MIEALFSLGVLAVLAGIALPSLLAGRDDARARGAADYLAARLHLARFEALKRNAHVALRFEPDTDPAGCAVYVDGNRNGVRTSDIDDGVDRVIRPFETVGQQFPGVRLGRDPAVPGVDGGEAAGGPVAVGRARMVSFSPEGTSTSGTVYLVGRGHRQFAVRILGPTGRVHVFEFLAGLGEWRLR